MLEKCNSQLFIQVMVILTVSQCVKASSTTVLYRTKQLTSTISGCDSKDCPRENNEVLKEVVKHCEYDIPDRYYYRCFKRGTKSRLEIATPELNCEAGYYGDPKVDENNPGYVIVEKKPCPTGYYQPKPSGCYDGCKLKHNSLDLLDNYKQFKVYSKGDSVSPAKVYCNFLLGYYSKDGENFLNYDDMFQWVYKSFCANVNDSNPCNEGQVPLHNRSCVVPCNSGYERDVYGNFQCKKNTVDKPTLENASVDENASVKEDAASEGGSGNVVIGGILGAVLAAAAVVVAVWCCRKRCRHNYERADTSDPPSSGSEEGYQFKKTKDDVLSQTMVHSLEIQMRSVGALIQNNDLMGTVGLVGKKDCVMTAWHTVLPILDPHKTGNLNESLLQGSAVFINFNESLIARPIKDYKIGEIVWKHVGLDVVVLSISNPDDNLPESLILWKGPMSSLELSDVSFAGYGYPKHPNKKHLDPRCKLVDPSSHRIKSAQAWLLKNTSKIEQALKRYNKDPISVKLGYHGYNRGENFLVDCYVEEGSSGSPGFTNNNESSIKVVGMLIKGFPKCYHDLQEHKSELGFPDEYKFETCVRMEHVYACMNADNPDLAKKLFM